jgi:small subunit ribosomal protein S20
MLWYDPARPHERAFLRDRRPIDETVPNIKQQKKRVRIAAEERIENLRYRSTIKTLTKRLATAVEDSDAAAVETEHKSLVRLIDRAVTRGALHRNAAARKKSQAARIVAGTDSAAGA